MTSPPKPDLDKLSEFVLGKLSPEESLAVLGLLEKDLQVSEDFELVLALLNLSKAEWEKSFRERN